LAALPGPDNGQRGEAAAAWRSLSSAERRYSIQPMTIHGDLRPRGTFALFTWNLKKTKEATREQMPI